MTYLKKSLQGRVPYHSGLITKGLILNANEAYYNIPESIIKQFNDKINTLEFNRYPDTDATDLRSSIARAYHISPSNVAVGVGSDSLIDCVSKAVLEPDDTILCLTPAFSMYREYAELYGSHVEYYDLDSFLSYPDKFVSSVLALPKTPKIIYMCTPNNPSGTIIGKKLIEDISKRINSLFIVDEAYGEFYYNDSLGNSMINESLSLPNVIVFKTFSKAYAFAAGRLGFAISSVPNIDMIETVKPPYYVNSLSLLLGRLIMDNKDEYKPYINDVIATRDYFYKELITLGFDFKVSYANFVYGKLEKPYRAALLNNNIFIRTYGESDNVRITIGSRKDMEYILEVLKNVK